MSTTTKWPLSTLWVSYPQRAHHHLFLEIPVWWPQSALPSVKSYTPPSLSKESKTVMPGYHFLSNPGMPKEKRGNLLATFEMLPTSGPTETVAVVVFETSCVGLNGLTESSRTLYRWKDTAFFNRIRGLLQSLKGAPLSGCCAWSTAVVNYWRNRETVTGSADRCSGSASLGLLAPSLEPEAHPTGYINSHLTLIKNRCMTQLPARAGFAEHPEQCLLPVGTKKIWW